MDNCGAGVAVWAGKRKGGVLSYEKTLLFGTAGVQGWDE